MSEDMPEDMPDRVPEDMTEHIAEDMPGRMPEDMPDRMPDKMPEDLSDKMPEDLPVTKCINVMVGITRSKVISFYKYMPLEYVKFTGKYIGHGLSPCIKNIGEISWPQLSCIPAISQSQLECIAGFEFQQNKNRVFPLNSARTATEWAAPVRHCRTAWAHWVCPRNGSQNMIEI